MTRLSYKIGNVEVVSFRMALELKKRTGLPIYKVYTKVEDEFKVNPELRERRANNIHNKIKVRVAH